MSPTELVIAAAGIVLAAICLALWRARSQSRNGSASSQGSGQSSKPNHQPVVQSKESTLSERTANALSGNTAHTTTEEYTPKGPAITSTITRDDNTGSSIEDNKPEPCTETECVQAASSQSQRESSPSIVKPTGVPPRHTESTTPSNNTSTNVRHRKVPRDENVSLDVDATNSSNDETASSTEAVDSTFPALPESDNKFTGEVFSETDSAAERTTDSSSVQTATHEAEAQGTDGLQADAAPLDQVQEAGTGTTSTTPSVRPESKPSGSDKLDEIEASAAATDHSLDEPSKPVQPIDANDNDEHIKVESPVAPAQPQQENANLEHVSGSDSSSSPSSPEHSPNFAFRAGVIDETSSPADGAEDPTTKSGPHTDRSEVSRPTKVKQGAKKKRSAPKYQPSARTAKATRRKSKVASAEQAQATRKTARTRTLSMALHVTFGRRNQCRVSLLPSRSADMPESVDVKGPDGIQAWDALQDEWYCDVIPAEFHDALTNGCVWELADATEDCGWTFSGRDICVLAQGSTISGYVSVPRLMLGEDHVVLCTDSMLDTVTCALREAGCEISTPISGNGVPTGWNLFSGVRPTTAVHHESDAGILNTLRPVYDVDIVLRHGIRLTHSKWLYGHPPRIRIRGRSDSDVNVLIDERSATIDDSGIYTAPGWDDRGGHTVFCGGKTQTYELIDGLKNWERCVAFQYRPTQSRVSKNEIVICGPIVDVGGDPENAFLTPSTNSCQLGAVPGQVSWSPAPYDTRNREYLAFADFPVVWTVPKDALRSDKSNACIKLIQWEPVENGRGVPVGTTRDAVLRWCRAILDASRKRLPLAMDTDETRKQWLQYKKVARRLWRLLR